MEKILQKSKITDFLQGLNADYDLIAPIKDEDTNDVEFKVIDSVHEITTDFSNSILPPKNYFFPQTENLFEFNEKNNDIQIKPLDGTPENERVLFGVRPCDVKSLQLLDGVFKNEFEDPYYINKRKNTIIIGLGCDKPMNTCFCTSFGFGPHEPVDSDVFFIDLGDVYYIQSFSSKGQELLQKYLDIFDEVNESYREIKKVKEDEVSKNISLQLEVDGTVDSMKEKFESSYWQDISQKCILCGVCTYLCPTCHCFDMTDDMKGCNGCRLRTWDSCMYEDFTEMAGGHNPRPGKKERVRQRFMHKLNYYPSTHKQYLCVGCGRCVEKCPVNMDITQIIGEIKDVKDSG